MDETTRAVSETLLQTLQASPATIKEAEQRLYQYEKQSGYCTLLLRLVCEESAGLELRQSAAVTFKNFVRRNWSDTPDVELSAEEEELIRNTVLEAMFLNKGSLQNMLSHSLHLIAKRDFPSKWPSLVPILTSHLGSDNLDKLVATLSAMDQLFRKFRYEAKCEDLWRELKTCLLTVQAPLTELYTKMVQLIPECGNLGTEQVDKWLEILLSICRVFHSLNFQELPEFFEDNMQTWMDGLQRLLALESKLQESCGGDPTTLDKMKTEICEIFSLYTQRYDEETMKYVESIVTVVWQQLGAMGPDTRFDGVICAALDFLSTISQKAYYEKYFTEESLKIIAGDICVRNLQFRSDDMDLFTDEPIDFMKRDLEGTDIGTRRRGAINLLRALCQRFEKHLLPIIGELVTMLSGDASWQNVDVVYCLVSAMASRTATARSGVTSTREIVDVNAFYESHCRAHLGGEVNDVPILKTDAIKYVVMFRHKLRSDILVEVISACDRLLSSEIIVLHKYAAYAIDKLLLVRDAENKVILNASVVPVSSLLTNLVSAFDKDPKAQNSPYLIKGVLRVITILDDNTAQHANAIASKLAELVAAATKTPADAVHTHFLFESMCALINKTSHLPTGGLEGELMPLVEYVITQELTDIIPYALQITGVLLAAAVSRGSSIDSFVNFLPHLMSPVLWSKGANIPASLAVLEVFLRHTPAKLVGENTHAVTVMQQFQRLTGNKGLEQYGFQLANALLPILEHIHGVEAVKVILNTMFQRIQNSKTTRFVRLFVVFIARFAIVRGAQDLLKGTSSIQANMYPMLFARVICPELESLKNLTTPADKRTIAIGFANILADTATSIPNEWSPLAIGVTRLVEGMTTMEKISQSPEEEQAAMYNDEGEFTNPYCRLSYGPKPTGVAPEVGNFKAYLAQAILQRGPTSNPSLSACISDELRAHLSTYLTC